MAKKRISSKSVKSKPVKKAASPTRHSGRKASDFESFQSALLQRFTDMDLKLESLGSVLSQVSREVADLADLVTRQPLSVHSRGGGSSNFNSSSNKPSSGSYQRPSYHGSKSSAQSESNQPGHVNEGRRGRTLYPAVCADCRKSCEVPVKVTEGRPVYCKQCFSMRKAATAHHSPDRRNAVAYMARKSGHREPGPRVVSPLSASVHAPEPKREHFQKKVSSNKNASTSGKKRK